MKRLIINTTLLPISFKHHRYMRSDDDREIDYLGQILTCLGYDIPYQCRTPSELGSIIPYFTFDLRGRPANTHLSLDILHLDNIDRRQHPSRLETLLSPLPYTLHWIR